MLADLFDHAVRTQEGMQLPALELPAHAPPLPTNLLPSSIAIGPNAPAFIGSLLAPSSGALAEGCTPLQYPPPHPGYIYYLAALCVFERRARFQKMVENGSANDEKASGFPALVHEKTVDHEQLIIEVRQESWQC